MAGWRIASRCDFYGEVAFNLIAPDTPARRPVSCEQFSARQVTAKCDYPLSDLGRLARMILYRRDNQTGNGATDASRMATYREQAELRIRSGPVAHTEVKTSACLGSLDPSKGHRLKAKTPCTDYVKGIWKHGICCPQKQHTIFCGKRADRQRANCLGAHSSIRNTPPCQSAFSGQRPIERLSRIELPGRIGIDDSEGGLVHCLSIAGSSVHSTERCRSAPRPR